MKTQYWIALGLFILGLIAGSIFLGKDGLYGTGSGSFISGPMVFSTASTTGLLSASSLSVLGTSALTGAAALSSTLNVTGATSLYSTLGVPAALTTLSTLSVTSTAAVYGATTLYSTLGVPAALTTLSSLSVTGTSAFATASSTGLFSLSSLKIGYGGTEITKHLKTTVTIDADSIGNGAATSSAVTLTGAAANGSVFVTRTGDWGTSSSTINIFGVAGTNSVTLYFQNNSSTAVNLSGSTYILDYYAH